MVASVERCADQGAAENPIKKGAHSGLPLLQYLCFRNHLWGGLVDLATIFEEINDDAGKGFLTHN